MQPSARSGPPTGVLVQIHGEKGLVDKLHRYKVRYIERDGYVDKVIVWAGSKGEARKIAERQGCEDILKVRRIGFPFVSLIVVLLILSAIVCLTVKWA